jgi:molybdopterin converting factor small subunit
MSVSIELFGMHRDIAQIEKVAMPITEKTKVRDALDYIRNKYPKLTLDKDSILTTVNHELAPPDRLLKADDTICIIPHIGGG